MGVGAGATTRKWYRGKRGVGGFATATIELPGDIIVAAFVVNNAIGDVGGDWTNNLPQPTDDVSELDGVIARGKKTPATTLSVVATNALLGRSQLTRVASMATHGLARSIHPVSLLSDGDTVFALSSLSGERVAPTGMEHETLVDIVGIGAAEAVRQAVTKTISTKA